MRSQEVSVLEVMDVQRLRRERLAKKRIAAQLRLYTHATAAI
jgi:hypothetical protein